MNDPTYLIDTIDETTQRKCFICECVSHMDNFVTHVDPYPQRYILNSRLWEYKAFLIKHEWLTEKEASNIINELK